MSTAAMSDSRRAAAWSPALRSMGLQCNLVTPNVNGKHIFSCAGEAERTARAAHDDRLAASLLQGGLPAFVDGWYRAPMWAGLRTRPGFDRIVRLRASTGAAR